MDIKLTWDLSGACKGFGLLTILVSAANPTWAQSPIPPREMLNLPTNLPTGATVVTGAADIRQMTEAERPEGFVDGLIIEQGSTRTEIEWDEYHIQRQHAVRYEQPSSSSVALNRINGARSEIHGNLQANGRVYLLNSNGVLFGNGARVNVSQLVASSLEMPGFAEGDLGAAIQNGDAYFDVDPDDVLTPEQIEALGLGNIDVEEGAIIAVEDGGRIILVAPEINNDGTLSVRRGQVILAATKDKAYLVHSDKDRDNPGRDYLVEVGTGGTVNNNGLILANQGGVTAVGRAINQNGRITATTSVDFNGTIRLLARDDAQLNPSSNVAGGIGTATTWERVLSFANEEKPSSAVIPVPGRSTDGSDDKFAVTFGEGSVTEVIAHQVKHDVASDLVNLASEAVGEASLQNLLFQNSEQFSVQGPDGEMIEVGVMDDLILQIALRQIDLGQFLSDDQLVNNVLFVTAQEEFDRLTTEGEADPVLLNAADIDAIYAEVEPLLDSDELKSFFQNSALRATFVERLVNQENFSAAARSVAQRASEISVFGEKIELKENSLVAAKGGEIFLSAQQYNYGDFVSDLFQSNRNVGDKDTKNDSGQTNVTVDESEIILRAGSEVDVSGYHVFGLPMSRNLLEVDVTGVELRNVPLQRDGVLFGNTVYVNLLNGESLDILDISGVLANREDSIQERLTVGGTVDIRSAGSFVQETGSHIDVSGGSLGYEAGNLISTYLVYNGRITDISFADPNLQYDAIYGDTDRVSDRWGIQSWSLSPLVLGGRREEAFVTGRDAGTFRLFVGDYAELNGSVDASAVVGRLQREVTNNALTNVLNRAFDEAPRAGEFLLDIGGLADSEQALLITDEEEMQGDDSSLILRPSQLIQSGARRIAVASNSLVSIQAAAPITFQPNTDMELYSQGGIEIDASLLLPSGSFTADTLSGRGDFIDDIDKYRDDLISLSSGSVIDVSGFWVNDSLDTLNGDSLSPKFIDAGDITFNAVGSLVLESGSKLLANGGGLFSVNNKLTAGRGGDITISAPAVPLLRERLSIESDLESFSFTQGGTLSLTVPNLYIGSEQEAVTLAADDTSPFAEGLILADSFFQQRGFSAYKLVTDDGVITGDGFTLFGKSVGEILVDEGASIQLQALNYSLADIGTNQLASLESGNQLTGLLSPTLLPDSQRDGVSLSLIGGSGVNPDAFESFQVLGDIAVVDHDGGIALQADHSLLVAGSLTAPGGLVSLTTTTALQRGDEGADIGLVTGSASNLGTSSPDLENLARQSIWVSDTADISVAARAVYDEPKPYGVEQQQLRNGSIADSGRVEITANRGYIVTQQGSRIDVSGTAARFDVSAAGYRVADGDLRYGQAGSLAITGTEGVYLDGEIDASAATENGQVITGAQGGSFELLFDPSLRDIATVSENDQEGARERVSYFNFFDPRIVLEAQDNLLLSEGTVFGDNILESIADRHQGAAVLSDDKLTQAGFTSVKLATKHDANDYAVQDGDDYLVITENLLSRIEIVEGVNLELSNRLELDTTIINLIATEGSEPAAGSARLAANNMLLGRSEGNTVQQALTDSSLIAEGSQLHFDANRSVNGAPIGQIALRGNLRVSGAETVYLDAGQDISARGYNQIDNTLPLPGSLVVDNNLDLTAAQIYPASYQSFTFTAEGDSITTHDSGGEQSQVYSISGGLTFQAANLDINSTIKAPLGRLNLQADESLLVADGADLSVDSPVVTIAGGIQGRSNLFYAVGENRQQAFDSFLEPAITLEAPEVLLKEGSRVDVAGGGDALFYQFSVSNQGSRDILNLAALAEAGIDANYFAIIPRANLTASPYDTAIEVQNDTSGTQLSDLGRTVDFGQTVYLEGTGDLPAGEYAVLPARYAMLEGAYLVTPREDVSVIQPNQTFTDTDGAAIIAGYFSSYGTDSRSSQWQAFKVEDGDVVYERSGYTTVTGNEWFASLNAQDNGNRRLPVDAGRVAIAAETNLELAAEFAFDNATASFNQVVAERRLQPDDNANSVFNAIVEATDPFAYRLQSEEYRSSLDITEVLGSENERILTVERAVTIAGKPGLLDITAPNLQVVSTLDDSASGVQVLDSTLNNSGAGSVLLGATRDFDGVTAHLGSVAEQVTVTAGSQIALPELILAASNRVDIETDTVLAVTDADVTTEQISLAGVGAIMRIAGGEQTRLINAGDAVDGAVLNVAEGATIDATSGAALFAATEDTVVDGELLLDQASLNVATDVVNLGATGDEVIAGFLLDEQQLAAFNLRELVLTSLDTDVGIRLFGSFDFTGESLVLQGSKLELNSAQGNEQITISASERIEVSNPDLVTLADATAGEGTSLTLEAAEISLGQKVSRDEAATEDNVAQQLQISGFEQITFNASERLVTTDQLLQINSDLTINAPLLTSAGGGNFELLGAHTLSILGDGELSESSGLSVLAGKQRFTAHNIVVDNAVQFDLPSGLLSLTATGVEDGESTESLLAGSGSISVGDAVFALGGSTQDFGVAETFSDGGELSLTALAGDITTTNATRIDLSAAEMAEQTAGTLNIAAESGSVVISDAQISAQGGASLNGQGGAFSLLANRLSDFPILSDFLSAAGFDRDISLRVKQGDLTQQAGQDLLAKNVTLAADTGSVSLQGQVGYASAEAGELQVYAQSITVGEEARLIAASTEEAGGDITLAGVGSGGVIIESGAVLDVRPGSASAKGGDIRIRVPYAGSNLALNGEFLLSHADGAAENQGRFYVEAITQQVLSADILDAAAFQTFFDTAVDNVDAFDQGDALADVSALPEFSSHGLVAFLEILSDGDVTISDALDLDVARSGAVENTEIESRFFDAPTNSDALYRWDNRTFSEGSFVLRAEGDIVVNEKVSDGFVSVDVDAAFPDFVPSFYPYIFSHIFEATLFEDSWSIGLVAGADTASSNTYAVKSADDSSLVLAEEGIIRTGTGDLNLVAAGNIEQGFNSAIYTAGKATGTQVDGEGLLAVAYDAATVSLGDLTAHAPYYATDGGDLTVTAGGDYISEGSDQFFSNWLHRIGNFGDTGVRANLIGTINRSPTAWLVIPTYFKQGLATFGGGDADISIAGNAYNLTASSPTEAKYLGDNSQLNRQATGNNILPTADELLADLLIMDSGDIRIDVGGDLYGAAVLIGNGQAEANVGGAVKAAPGETVLYNGVDPVSFANLGFIGAVMDGQLSLTAGGDIDVETIFNPTVLNQSDIQGQSYYLAALGPNPGIASRDSSFFFTYGAESSFSAKSLAGDITLRNSGDRIRNYYEALYNASSSDSDLVGLNFMQRWGGGELSTVSTLSVLPTKVSIQALGGDVSLVNNMEARHRMILYPHMNNDLDILAAGDISPASRVEGAAVDNPIVLVPIIDPELLPTVQNPFAIARTNATTTTSDGLLTAFDAAGSLDFLLNIPVGTTDGSGPTVFGNTAGVDSLFTWFSRWLPESPTHAESTESFTLATLEGDIHRGDATQFSIFLPGESHIRAGNDINSITLEIYHGSNLPDQLSTIAAGGDIVFAARREATGRLADDNNRFNIHGGGDLLVSAVGDVELGTSQGIRSLGNSFISNLADSGANISVSAGVPLDVDLTSFYQSGLPDLYSAELIDFVVADSFPDSLSHAVSEVTGEDYTSEAQARAALLELDDSQQFSIALEALQSTTDQRQQLFAHRVFYEEINNGGLEATGQLASETPDRDDCANGYARACNAIDILFPDERLTESRIDMVASTIQTREGGDVNLLAPASSIDVGVATGGVQSANRAGFDPEDNADRFGILALENGRINAFVRDNINVAESRVVTLAGGRVMLYSEQGSIDAGRGARTAGSAGVYTVREDGAIETPKEVSGSGIRNASPPGITAESVNLWAPSGSVDAGEAGISSAGRIFIGAQSVLNADAISAEGDVSGTVDLGATGSALSALSSVTSASQSAASDSLTAQTSAPGDSEATLTVRLLRSTRSDEGS